MRIHLFLIIALFFLTKTLRASEVDTSKVITVEFGFNSYEYQQASPVQNISGSFSWSTKSIVDFIGLSHVTEDQLFVGEGFNKGYSYPYDYENKIFAGHQIRFKHSILYLPLSFGLSGSFGVYRGNYLRENDNNVTILSETYQRKTFYAPGLFIGANPSLLFSNSISLGINSYLDVNTHQVEFGFGLQLGIMFGGETNDVQSTIHKYRR